MAGEIEGRGARVGQALPQPDANRLRDRDPAGLRGRGLRRGADAGAARERRAHLQGGGQEMKYLCLVYGEEQAISKMPDAHCVAFDEEVRKSGHCIASEALQPVATATTVRVRNAKVPDTTGPSAETKQATAGFHLTDATDQ